MTNPLDKIADAAHALDERLTRLENGRADEAWATADADWDESKHPRGEGGQFGSGGGGNTVGGHSPEELEKIASKIEPRSNYDRGNISRAGIAGGATKRFYTQENKKIAAAQFREAAKHLRDGNSKEAESLFRAAKSRIG